MSVLCESHFGVVLDHQKYSQEVYTNSSCSLKSEYFKIHAPYFSVALKNSTPSTKQLTKIPSKRKRKRNVLRNHGQIASDDYHQKVSLLIKMSFNTLRSIFFNTNKRITHEKLNSIDGRSNPPQDVISVTGPTSHLFQNENSFSIYIKYQNETYIIPPKSSFLNSDIYSINPLLELCERQGKFDMVLMDPPWENKSAKRGKKYNWMSEKQMLDIPLKNLMAHNGYIAVWVTNKQKFYRFVIDHLFPLNGVELITEWYWVKITTNFEPVIDFESTHKKPYEILIIGKQNSNIKMKKNAFKFISGVEYAEDTDLSTSSNTQNINAFKHGTTFQRSKVLCSVPCKVHSHKPPLDQLIRRYLVPHLTNPKCLELFARNLLPNWTSCGNEVLYMQNLDHYDIT